MNQEDSGEWMGIIIDHLMIWMPKKSSGVHEKEGKNTVKPSSRAWGLENREPPKTDDKWTPPKGGLPSAARPEGWRKKFNLSIYLENPIQYVLPNRPGHRLDL